MRVREYLDQFPSATPVTFIKQVSVKDEGAPGYRSEYRTTPIFSAWEWLNNEDLCDEYLVINADHPPIDVTGGWHNRYKSGLLKCAMITTEAELRKLYSEEQAQSMVRYYERTVY